MITLYLGLGAKNDFLAQSTTKGGVVYRLGNEDPVSTIIEALTSQDLFGGVNTIVLREALLGRGAQEIAALDTALAESPHHVFAYEEDNSVTELYVKTIKVATVIKKEEKKEKAYESATIFSLADAYISGNKKDAWIELRKAIRAGSGGEEIQGTLFWALKSLWLSRILKETDAEGLGVKPFVLKKYRSMGAGWEEYAIIRTLRELKDMYHEAHRGKGELELMIERHILGLEIKK